MSDDFLADYEPSIAVSDNVVHIVWNDGRDGNPEIYYKKNSRGGTVNIENDNSQLSDDFKLTQNPQKPFNYSTVIRYQLAVGSDISLKVSDVLGKELQY